MVKAVFGLGTPRIRVGVLQESGSKTKDGSPSVTVLDVAFWNEFGTKTIPSRSFIRAWFTETEPQIREKLGGLMAKVLMGRLDKKTALDQLGVWMVGSIQARMSRGIPPPNAASTILRKGSSKPLIDTGQLRASITFKVEGL